MEREQHSVRLTAEEWDRIAYAAECDERSISVTLGRFLLTLPARPSRLRATSPATPRNSVAGRGVAKPPIPTQADAVARESDGIVREPARDEA